MTNVRSLAQGFAIIRILAESNPLTLSEICRLVGLSPSSCLNLLRTLIEERVIERDIPTKRYRLAPAWQNVQALRDGAAARLVDRAQAPMIRLAQTTETAVGLWKIVSRDRMQLAAHAESDAGMRLRLADDQRQPLGGGAVGRAIAAGQEAGEAELRRRYALVRWQSDLPFEAYAQQIREAVDRGFAIDRGFAHRGVCTVAAPITNVAPGFCLSASFVLGSRADEQVEELGIALLAVREAVLRASENAIGI